MTRRIKGFINITVFVWAIVGVMLAYCLGDFNPFEWPAWARYTQVVSAIYLSVCYMAFYWEEHEKSRLVNQKTAI